MKLVFPIGRDAPRRSRDRLIERMVARGSERHTLYFVLGVVVPEPVLAGLVARHHRVVGIERVVLRVL